MWWFCIFCEPRSCWRSQVTWFHMWREDVSDNADFCTSNGAQVTCDTFRYLLRSAWPAGSTRRVCFFPSQSRSSSASAVIWKIWWQHFRKQYISFEALHKRFWIFTKTWLFPHFLVWVLKYHLNTRRLFQFCLFCKSFFNIWDLKDSFSSINDERKPKKKHEGKHPQLSLCWK